jgi:hypothetical protein
MKKESVLASAVAVLAVACCAALPSVAWLAGSVTAAVVLGAGAAVVAVVALAGSFALGVRRRRRRAVAASGLDRRRDGAPRPNDH